MIKKYIILFAFILLVPFSIKAEISIGNKEVKLPRSPIKVADKYRGKEASSNVRSTRRILFKKASELGIDIIAVETKVPPASLAYNTQSNFKEPVYYYLKFKAKENKKIQMFIEFAHTIHDPVVVLSNTIDKKENQSDIFYEIQIIRPF